MKSTKSMQRIWSAVENNGGEPAPATIWRRQAGADFDALTQHVLKSEPQLARTIPCPHPARPGACHLITDLGEGNYEATCSDPDGCGTARIDAHELIMWNVSMSELIRATCAALDIRMNVTPLHFIPRAQSLGLFTPHANHQFPAFFLIPSCASELETSITQLLAHNAAPIIVVVPTDRHISTRVSDLLRQRGTCIPLARLVGLGRNGHLVPLVEAKACREVFCDKFVGRLPSKPSATRYLMSTGTKWADITLRFANGETIEVTAPDGIKSFNYVQMGMDDRRNKWPDKQWELLRDFARDQGTFTWRNRKANTRQQKTKENLAKRLTAFFGVKGDPIANISDGWKTNFQVVSDCVEKSTENPADF